MSHRMSRTAFLCGAIAVFGLYTHDARGQSVAEAAAVHATCRDPHPAPPCARYFLFEMTGTVRIGGTQTEAPGCLSVCTRPALPAWLAWDAGWMRNAGTSRAYGGSVQVGGSEEGVRIALKARHRSWLAHDRVVDAAAGPLMTQLQAGGGDAGISQTYGATADIGVGFARLSTRPMMTDLPTRVERRDVSKGTLVARAVMS